MQKLQNYIGGELKDPLDGKYLDNYNPATGEVYSNIPDSGEKDVQLAVEAAQKAAREWGDMPVSRRSDILMKVAQLIDDNAEMMAEAESIDNGKPVKLARKVDIPRASANFRFFATAILHFSSEAHHTDNVAINYTQRSPLGIVGCISPWNLPIYLFTWKIAPALASGNCVIAKPSELTPMTSFILSELCIKAGMPPGVLNILHGLGSSVGEEIVKHPEIKAISFTGGTATGQRIASIAAPMFKKLSLELGGKNPNIVFEDCDFESTVKESVKAAFSNQGEICLCGSRILVEESLYPKFRDAFVERTRTLQVGDPADDSSHLGALVSESHMNKVLSYIDLAKEEGGTILTGGNRVVPEGRCENGYYVEPTVIEGLDHLCRTNQEEIFGPVVTLMPFKNADHAVEIANSTPYGLSATVFTTNLNKAHNIASRLNSGIVWINCWLLRDLRTPFGGMKQSGVGREGGLEVLRFFTEPKNVCVGL